MVKYLSLLASVVVMFSGCGTSIGSIDAYTPVPLEKSSFMPSKEELKSGKTKVVLTAINDGDFKLAKEAHLGQSLYIELERELSTSGTAEILDRSIAKKFEKEIRLSEMGSESQMGEEELSVAKYAISGSLSNVQFTSRFVEVSKFVDKKGRVIVIPAHYIYTASVSGILKIYSIPSMKVLKTIEFSDNTMRSEDSKRYEAHHMPSDVSGMINKAGRSAIHATRHEFKNFLAPKGYIMAKRVKDDMNIVQVSIGKLDGLKEGNDVKIFTTVSTVNPLTDEKEIKDIKIADGVVSENVSDHDAWIIVKESTKELKLGDYAKATYSKGFADYLNDAGKLYTNIMQ